MYILEEEGWQESFVDKNIISYKDLAIIVTVYDQLTL